MAGGGSSSSRTSTTTTNISDQSVRIGDIGLTGNDAVNLAQVITDASIRSTSLLGMQMSYSDNYQNMNNPSSPPIATATQIEKEKPTSEVNNAAMYIALATLVVVALK